MIYFPDVYAAQTFNEFCWFQLYGGNFQYTMDSLPQPIETNAPSESIESAYKASDDVKPSENVECAHDASDAVVEEWMSWLNYPESPKEASTKSNTSDSSKVKKVLRPCSLPTESVSYPEKMVKGVRDNQNLLDKVNSSSPNTSDTSNSMAKTPETPKVRKVPRQDISSTEDTLNTESRVKRIKGEINHNATPSRKLRPKSLKFNEENLLDKVADFPPNSIKNSDNFGMPDQYFVFSPSEVSEGACIGYDLFCEELSGDILS